MSTSGNLNSEILEYFESIREPLRKTLTAFRKRQVAKDLSEWSFPIALGIGTLSLMALAYLTNKYARLHAIQDFLLVGPAATAFVTLSAWSLVLRFRWRRERDDLLSMDQVRFGLCLLTLEDLKNFEKNHTQSNLDRASESFGQLLKVLREVEAVSRLSSFGAYPWFRLEPDSNKIAGAFDSLNRKVRSRISDRRDIPILANAVAMLGAYLYYQIPEIASEMGPLATQIGASAVAEFSDILVSMPEYVPEGKRSGQKLTDSVRRYWIATITSMANPVLRFFTWAALVALLETAGWMLLARHFNRLSFDNTVAVTCVATPIIAAALTAITPRRSVPDP